MFKAKPEPGENKVHSGVFGPGTQPQLELEQPKLLTCGPTEAKLMRINWFFLCTTLSVIGSLDMLAFSFTYRLTWALGYGVWRLNSGTKSSSHILPHVHPLFLVFPSSFHLPFFWLSCGDRVTSNRVILPMEDRHYLLSGPLSRGVERHHLMKPNLSKSWEFKQHGSALCWWL